MATNRKKDTYSTEGLGSKAAVQQALASAQYKPSASVSSAASDLEAWQASRPSAYKSQYQGQGYDEHPDYVGLELIHQRRLLVLEHAVIHIHIIIAHVHGLGNEELKFLLFRGHIAIDILIADLRDHLSIIRGRRHR